MNDIAAKLDALVAALQQKGIDPLDNLRPGLDEAGLDRAANALGTELPDELRSLYAWRNGCIEVSAPPEKLLVFRDMAFLSLDDAATARQYIRGFLDAYSSAGLPIPFAPESLIPIAEFDGQYYAVLAGPSQLELDHPNPVVTLGEDLAVHFYSVSSMLDTCLEWVNDAQYSIEVPEPADEMIAWEKHNPGVFDLQL